MKKNNFKKGGVYIGAVIFIVALIILIILGSWSTNAGAGALGLLPIILVLLIVMLVSAIFSFLSLFKKKSTSPNTSLVNKITALILGVILVVVCYFIVAEVLYQFEQVRLPFMTY